MLRILLCRRKHVIYQMCLGPKPYFAQVLNLNIDCQIDYNKLNKSHEMKYESPCGCTSHSTISAYDKPLPVAVRVNNPDRSALSL